jgi:DNA (cytosine-5)-methyltransferase 1
VIENVAYHRTGLSDPLTLCGASFGLIVYRHRWFEFGGGWVKPPAPEHRPHSRLTMRNGYLPDADRPMMTITGRNGHHSKAWVRAAANAMGTYWLANNLNSVCEAIPPAYTQYIGSAFMERDR